MKGIVTAAGGYRLLANAYVTLSRLRRLSRLPIELFHAQELPQKTQRKLERDLAVTCRDVGPGFRGWHIKIKAILESSFEEVLWLDADNLPLEPVDELFEDPAYRETGALFWPDQPEARWTTDRLFETCGLDPALNRQSPEFESGQMVLDKRRCDHALQAVQELNGEQERPFVYSQANGDKDTFRLGFLMTQTDYALIDTPPVEFGAPYLSLAIPFTRIEIRLAHPRGRYRRAGLLQHDSQGRPLFAHKTVLEWNPYHDFKTMTMLGEATPAPRLAALEEEGLRDLKAFRSRYRQDFKLEFWARFQRPLAALLTALTRGR